MVREICRFRNKCERFDKENPACTNNAGKYYGENRYLGCFIRMDKKEQEAKENAN